MFNMQFGLQFKFSMIDIIFTTKLFIILNKKSKLSTTVPQTGICLFLGSLFFGGGVVSLSIKKINLDVYNIFLNEKKKNAEYFQFVGLSNFLVIEV